MERLLTVGEVAMRLRLSPDTIRRTEKLRPVALSERGVRLYSPEDVERLQVERGKRKQHKSA